MGPNQMQTFLIGVRAGENFPPAGELIELDRKIQNLAVLLHFLPNILYPEVGLYVEKGLNIVQKRGPIEVGIEEHRVSDQTGKKTELEKDMAEGLTLTR